MKYFIPLILVLLLTSCTSEQQAQNSCKNDWLIIRYYNDLSWAFYCETIYEKCLKITRYTFEDLSDTWGNNTNNQDTISKSMKEEIGRCIENLTPKK